MALDSMLEKSPGRYAQRIDTNGIQPSPRAKDSAGSRGPISPPPLRRARSSAEFGSAPVSVDGANEVFDDPLENGYEQLTQVMTPMSKTSGSTVSSPRWADASLAQQLQAYYQDVLENHGKLVAHFIESTTTSDRRVKNGTDLFVSLRSEPVPGTKGQTMLIRQKVTWRH